MERRWLEEKGRADGAYELLREEQGQWREAYGQVVRWMGRAGFGFGVGDPIPVKDEIRSDKVRQGRMTPVQALEEIIHDAKLRFGNASSPGA